MTDQEAAEIRAQVDRWAFPLALALLAWLLVHPEEGAGE